MENLKVFSKIKFRELNLSGPNNVKSLNELEDRLLRTSIDSLEKAKKKSLTRLDSEVKGLHHTLREHNTVRPVNSYLARKIYASSELSTFKQATPPALCKKNEGTRFSYEDEKHLSESEESEEEEAALEDKDDVFHKDKTTQDDNAIITPTPPPIRKSSSTSPQNSPRKIPPHRILRRQLSSPAISPSAVAIPSAQTRKISSVDPPSTARDIRFASPRLLRRPLTCSSIELSGPLSRSASNLSASNQSIRHRKISSGSYSAHVCRERTSSTGSSSSSFQERCAMTDGQCSVDSSPVIPRRKYSQIQQPTSVSQKQSSRKISCPQPVRRIQQEEFYDLHVHRAKPKKGHEEGTRSCSTSELPRLGEPSSGLICEPDFGNLSVSPVGRHIDGLDHMLQARVNNFLMSLETFRKDGSSEENNEDK